MGTPSQSYGTSLAIWDHTVLYLPPDKSKRAPPNPIAMQAGTCRLVLDLPNPEGWKAELT